jgi:hypothetical protein
LQERKTQVAAGLIALIILALVFIVWNQKRRNAEEKPPPPGVTIPKPPGIQGPG